MYLAAGAGPSLLPESAQTWVDQHVEFTHGSELTIEPGQSQGLRGLADLLSQGHPGEIERGDAYGSARLSTSAASPDDCAVVDAAPPEFDYPSGSDDVFAYYTAAGFR